MSSSNDVKKLSLRKTLDNVIHLNFSKNTKNRKAPGWTTLSRLSPMELHAPWVLRLIAVLLILILSMLIL